jgi:hypothetical protein
MRATKVAGMMVCAGMDDVIGIAHVFPLIPDLHRCLSQGGAAKSQCDQHVIQDLST